MSLPTYILNLDEINAREIFLKTIKDKLKEKLSECNKDKIEEILKKIEILLPTQLINFQNMVNDVVNFIIFKLNGKQKIKGFVLDIPPLKNNIIEQQYIFENDSFLIGITVTQTGWQKSDKFNIKINNKFLLNNIYLKEVGQHNFLNGVCKLSKGDIITIIYNNKEGNSKQFMLDLEYLTL